MNKPQNLEMMQWIKAILFVGCLMLIRIVIAEDSIKGAEELNEQATTVKSIIQFVAKWGGILAVVSSVLAIGFGYAKGTTAQVICSIFIVVGGIAAAWGWFDTKFAHGFVW